MRSQQEISDLFRRVFEDEIMSLREAGQKEYAMAESNAFANFERVASDLGINRKLVLWTYVRKHLDGICSFLRGHISQRENVRGRINDAIVYLLLLRGMIEDDEQVRAMAQALANPLDTYCPPGNGGILCGGFGMDSQRRTALDILRLTPKYATARDTNDK